MSNRFGIPNINSTGVNVTATAVEFTFDDSRDLPFAGMILARLVQSIPTGTRATLPIQFGNVPLKGYGGRAITVADIKGTGIYAVYYNSQSKLLQLLTGV